MPVRRARCWPAAGDGLAPQATSAVRIDGAVVAVRMMSRCGLPLLLLPKKANASQQQWLQHRTRRRRTMSTTWRGEVARRGWPPAFLLGLEGSMLAG